MTMKCCKALVSLVFVSSWLVQCSLACGDFQVDYTCTERSSGQPCETLRRRDEPGWTCFGDGNNNDQRGCVTSLTLRFTGHQCREYESTAVRACRFSVFHEDCERHDAEGNDWVTDCLEYQPTTVDITAKGGNDEVLFQGTSISQGETFVLHNNGECIPNEVILEAVEPGDSYEVTGVDFRSYLEIVAAADESMPFADYGAFRLEHVVCDTDHERLLRFKNTPPEDCFTNVDLQFCVSTDSINAIHLRFDDVEYNKADVLSEDFPRGDVLLHRNAPWCRDVYNVPLDLCRRQHTFSYEFGTHNTECTQTTVLTKPSFNLRF